MFQSDTYWFAPATLISVVLTNSRRRQSRPEPDRFPQESVKSKTVLNIEWMLDLIHQGHLHNSKWLQMLLLISWMCGFLLTSSQYQLNFSSGQQKSVCIVTEWNHDLLLYCMQHRLLYNTLSSSTILPPGGTISVQSFIICHSLEWYIYLQRSPNRGRRACHLFHQGVFSIPAPLSSRHPRSPDFCPTLAGALQACRKFSVKMAKKEEIKEKKKWQRGERSAWGEHIHLNWRLSWPEFKQAKHIWIVK